MPSIDPILINLISLIVGLLTGASTAGGVCVKIYRCRELRKQAERLRRHHDFISPVLTELRNGLGTKLDPGQSRFLGYAMR